MAKTYKLEPDQELKTDAVDFSFGEIANLHKDREIVIQPEYQRLFRWTNEQRSRLIESIVLQLPIPPIFLVENDDGVLELIDGLQRISSVIQFIDNESLELEPLKLVGCDLLSWMNGKTFQNLTLSQRLRIKRTPIRAVIIRKSGNQYIRYELFKRLNPGGSLLSAQEIRNCSARMVDGGEAFYEFLQELARDGNYRKSISRLPDPQREQRGDEELVLRFFAVINFRNGYHGNIQEWLDDYMERILFDEIEFPKDKNKRKFAKMFEFIAKNFEGDAFARHRDGEAQGRLAPAYFEAVVGGLFPLLDKLADVKKETIKKTLIKAFANDRFKDVTGPGANSREKLTGRIEIVSNEFEAIFDAQ